jgi:hypothetical protein
MEALNNLNENLVITKKQMETILNRQFKNNRHWEIFQNHFLFHPKPSLFEVYRWSEYEYEEITSMG